jgi:osmotically-inducible protein OsmY
MRSNNMNATHTPLSIMTLAVSLLSIGVVWSASAATPDRESPRDIAWSDAETRGRAQAALARDQAIECWEFDVDVENGVLTLRGHVDSKAERKLAADIAKDVRGVRYVRNLLRVKKKRFRREAYDIEADIEGLFRMDPRIEAAMIDVTVRGGNVRLAGSVGARQEKMAARSLARSVDGVQSVEADELNVRKWLHYDTDVWYPRPTDREVEAITLSAIESHPQVQVRNLVVDVDGDVAVLSGTVKTLTAKRAAGQEARSTSGIRHVRNYLDVRPIRRSDWEIMGDILRAFENDQELDSQGISVNVYNQKAILSGTVDSRAMKRKAEEVASKVKGLTGITNTLTITHRSYEGG